MKRQSSGQKTSRNAPAAASALARALALALGLVFAGGFAAAQGAAAQSADEILARLDAGSSFATIRYSGRMEITVGGQKRVKAMDAMAEGSDRAFIEFTNPEDRGVRYLKLGKELWMYFPKEDDTVKISGHLLKEGMMGSDLSYEDALESGDYKARYSASLKGEETVDGRRCFVVQLDAKVAAAPYQRRIMWIDAERWVGLKEEMYAKSGKLLKVSRSLKVERLGSRWYPTQVELESRLRRDTRTLFSLSEVVLDAALPARAFTMESLTR